MALYIDTTRKEVYAVVQFSNGVDLCHRLLKNKSFSECRIIRTGYYMHPYNETLSLVHRSNCSIMDDNKTESVGWHITSTMALYSRTDVQVPIFHNQFLEREDVCCFVEEMLHRCIGEWSYVLETNFDKDGTTIYDLVIYKHDKGE